MRGPMRRKVPVAVAVLLSLWLVACAADPEGESTDGGGPVPVDATHDSGETGDGARDGSVAEASDDAEADAANDAAKLDGGNDAATPDAGDAGDTGDGGVGDGGDGGDASGDAAADAPADAGGPPVIAAPVVVTPFDDGVKFFEGAAAGTLAVTVTLKGIGAAIAESTIRLAYQPPANPAVQLVTGTRTAIDADGTLHYQFALPRAAGLACGASGTTACDGALPTVLSVAASDQLGRASTSAPANVFFDGVAPAVTVDTDPTWHPTSATLTVKVTIDDGSGAGIDPTAARLNDPGGSGTLVGCTGNVCTFSVPASQFGAGEGTLALTAVGADKVGNASTGNGTRLVDGKPPVVTLTKIYPSGGAAGSGVVAYPAAVARTGYTGSTFFLNDSVHVSATLVDGASGISAASVQLRIDGTTTGAPFGATATCSDSQHCTLEADVVLNAPGNGAFGYASGAGNYSLSVLGSDAVFNAGASAAVTVAATRFWWSRQIAAGNVISGVAVHTTGDVVVTTLAGASADTVFGLFANGPFGPTGVGCATGGVRWCYGGADAVGSVAAAPAIGEESAAGARNSRIYVGSNGSGKLLALDATGVRKWIASASTAFTTAPAVGKVAITGFGAQETAVVGGLDGAFHAAREDALTPGTAVLASGGTGDVFQSSSPVLTGGAFYAANLTSAQRIAILPNGSFGVPSPYAASATALGDVAFGGSNLLYAASTSDTTGPLQQFVAQVPPVRGWAADPTLGGRAAAGPLVASGVVFAATVSPSNLLAVTIANQQVRTVQTFGARVTSLLLGSDGRAYVTLADGNVHAVNAADGTSQWNLKPGTTATAVAMDCAGHLYVAVGDSLFAYLTDAQGLANAPWPKARRDSRNSGNSDLSTLWGARVSGVCAQ